jgi:hypothetical protein
MSRKLSTACPLVALHSHRLQKTLAAHDRNAELAKLPAEPNVASLFGNHCRDVARRRRVNKKSNNSIHRIHVEPPSTPVLKIGDQSTATLRNKYVPNARVSPEASAPAAQLQAILPRRKEW